MRVIGSHSLAYVGQTSRLRGRLGDLAVVYRDEIPYNDPHTAAPCLWVLRTRERAVFEFSTLESESDAVGRMALECLAISEHRLKLGASPIANFGRMPDGWVKSSGNTSALARRGGLRRGHPDTNARRVADLSSLFEPSGDPVAPRWSGLEWSPWEPFPARPRGIGLYRIRKVESNSLAYIGQGQVEDRLRAHAAKTNDETHRQSQALSGPMEASWVLTPSLEPQQLLEAECDLIAGHVSRIGRPPTAQFKG